MYLTVFHCLAVICWDGQTPRCSRPPSQELWQYGKSEDDVFKESFLESIRQYLLELKAISPTCHSLERCQPCGRWWALCGQPDKTGSPKDWVELLTCLYKGVIGTTNDNETQRHWKSHLLQLSVRLPVHIGRCFVYQDNFCGRQQCPGRKYISSLLIPKPWCSVRTVFLLVVMLANV